MNIKELSIGNIVEACGLIAVVDEIHETEVAVKSLKGMAWVLIDEIRPVPITPAFLEKNGWKLGEYSSATLVFEDKIVVVEFYESGTQFRIFERTEDEDLQILDIRVSGVHQLQNALTLCGIKYL